jgi:type IV fimbrial biogenesis protein FimT
MRRPAGVTLIELVIALAVLGILVTLATPAFSNLVANSSRTTAVNDLFHALFLARSEAIKRGRIVSLCPSSDGQTCSRQRDWTSGWMVFVNEHPEEPAARQENEPVLNVYQGWSGGQITSNRLSYSFRPFIQGVVNGTIVFCDDRGSEHARAIIISHTGRPRIDRRDSSNKPLKC